jgi:hypothetical protein
MAIGMHGDCVAGFARCPIRDAGDRVEHMARYEVGRIAGGDGVHRCDERCCADEASVVERLAQRARRRLRRTPAVHDVETRDRLRRPGPCGRDVDAGQAHAGRMPRQAAVARMANLGAVDDGCATGEQWCSETDRKVAGEPDLSIQASVIGGEDQLHDRVRVPVDVVRAPREERHRSGVATECGSRDRAGCARRSLRRDHRSRSRASDAIVAAPSMPLIIAEGRVVVTPPSSQPPTDRGVRTVNSGGS